MTPPHRAPLLLQHSLGLLLALWLSAALFQRTTAAESILLDPQYYNIAPCPCNLQPSTCDVGCCCDSACSASDKSLFDCVSGFYGGNTTVELYRRCASTDRDNPDYHPFTCVLIEDYNAYLGLYFPVQTTVSDTNAFDTKVSTASTDALLHQFPAITLVGLSEDSPLGVQHKGLILLQRPNSTTTPYFRDGSQMANYRLNLPRRTLTGGCDRSAGVVYLEDSTSACDLTITEDLCKPGVASPLDVEAYATDCNSTNTCKAWVKMRSNFATSSASVPVTVTYRNRTTAYGYQKGLTSISSTGSGSRQSPSLSSNVCKNAVVAVQYNLVWSGSTLISLTATVDLAPVAVGSVVTQRYVATFSHLASIDSGSSSSVVKRSGLLGYDPGAQLIGGSSDTPVNATSSYWPRLWRSNSAGACDPGQVGDPVLFPMDATSYCTEKVNRTDFFDCAGLRSRLQKKLKDQFPARVIGIFGSANTSVAEDWVKVLEQGLTNLTSENFTSTGNSTQPWTSLTGVCLGLPTEIVLTVLYAEQGKANDSSLFQVVGAYLRYKQVHMAPVCTAASCNTTSIAMSTGVQFIQVPPNDGTYFGPYKAICWWGICWEEFAYPLTADFEGESRAMCIAWCIFLVLVAVYAFCISRPWW